MASSELVQVITGDGAFDQPALERLMASSSSSSSSSAGGAAWADATKKNDYQVVAIMGPQSSGKSTLMNYLVR
jgi:polynucleotide 5'-kinase involved in rRNA processing